MLNNSSNHFWIQMGEWHFSRLGGVMTKKRFTVLCAARFGINPGVFRVHAVVDTQEQAEQIVRDEQALDAKPPRGHYCYKIIEEVGDD